MNEEISKFNRCKPALTLIACAVGFTCSNADSASLVVDDTADALIVDSAGGTCTLREAIVSVSLGTSLIGGAGGNEESGCGGVSFGTDDQILFSESLEGQTVTTLIGTEGFAFNKNVSINPEPNSRSITWSANNQSRHFFVSGGSGNNPIVYLNNVDLIDGNNTGDSFFGGYGSSIVINGGTLTISNSSLMQNTASSTAVIAAFQGTYSSHLNLENSVVSSNSSNLGGGSGNFGGGLLLSTNAGANIVKSTISQNRAGRGGGIGMVGSGPHSGNLTISNSTISGNTSTEYGGGLTVLAATQATKVSISNSTISGNKSNGDGAGIKITRTPTIVPVDLELSNTTIANNEDTTAISMNNPGTGGISANFADVAMRNTIVADSNLYAFNCNSGSGSTFNLGSDSIIEGTHNCGASARNGDPNLMSLADNGGPTQTHALAVNSIALNTADPNTCLSQDQRGAAREIGSLILPIPTANNKVAIVDLSGRCDVGSVEMP